MIVAYKLLSKKTLKNLREVLRHKRCLGIAHSWYAELLLVNRPAKSI
jgi:hypothetical protein